MLCTLVSVVSQRPASSMGKRQVAQLAGSSPATSSKAARGSVPRVAALTALSMGGSATFSEDGDGALQLSIMRYCDDGSVYSNCFSEGPLHVVHIVSSPRPSPVFRLKQMIELLGKHHRTQVSTATAESMGPGSLDELGQMYQTIYQWVGRSPSDPDEVGWAKYRSGFYVSGGVAGVKNFLMYFDDLLAWRAKHADDVFDKLAWDKQIEVHIEDGIPLEIDAEADDTQCKFTLHKGKHLDVNIFQLPPPTFPSRIVIVTFELARPDEVHVVFLAAARRASSLQL